MTELDPVAPVAAIVVVPLIIAFIQGAKVAGLPARWAPVVACVLGLAIALLATYQSGSGDWLTAVLSGLAQGLSAVGLYSGGKAVYTKGSPRS